MADCSEHTRLISRKSVSVADGHSRIFLNPNCSYGLGYRKWQRIEDWIMRTLDEPTIEVINTPDDMIWHVQKAEDEGVKRLIAAGGDGAVNLLLNAVMRHCRNPNRVTIGAIGLGSSNDFHKPFRCESMIDGIPVRLDFKNTPEHDVIKIDILSFENEMITRYCLINAAVGITAEANHLFNSRYWWVQELRKVSLDLAISAVAFRTMSSYKSLISELRIDGETIRDVNLTNLGVIKNPHFTGSLCYDTKIKPDDGKLGVNLSYNMSLFRTVKTFYSLSRRRFTGLPGTQSWKAQSVSVNSDQNFTVEMDGETMRTNKVSFTIIPKAIRCCR